MLQEIYGKALLLFILLLSAFCIFGVLLHYNSPNNLNSSNYAERKEIYDKIPKKYEGDVVKLELSNGDVAGVWDKKLQRYKWYKYDEYLNSIDKKSE